MNGYREMEVGGETGGDRYKRGGDREEETGRRELDIHTGCERASNPLTTWRPRDWKEGKRVEWREMWQCGSQLSSVWGCCVWPAPQWRWVVSAEWLMGALPDQVCLEASLRSRPPLLHLAPMNFSVVRAPLHPSHGQWRRLAGAGPCCRWAWTSSPCFSPLPPS